MLLMGEMAKYCEKVVKIIKETAAFAEKELEKNKDKISSYQKEQINTEIKHCLSGGIDELAVLDKRIKSLFGVLPTEIHASVKKFYADSINALNKEEEDKKRKEAAEKEQEELEYKKYQEQELAKLKSAYSLLYNQGRPENSYTHEIVAFDFDNDDTEEYVPYPYKSKNIVDLMEEIETVRYYIKLGYKTSEDIEWQQFLDSLSAKPKVIKQTKKYSPVVECPVKQLKKSTQEICLTSQQTSIFNEILQKVCANCVSHNKGR